MILIDNFEASEQHTVDSGQVESGMLSLIYVGESGKNMCVDDRRKKCILEKFPIKTISPEGFL